MKTYEFRGIEVNGGRSVTGTRLARDAAELSRVLRNDGIMLLSATEIGGGLQANTKI